jgi:hypothetical protein
MPVMPSMTAFAALAAFAAFAALAVFAVVVAVRSALAHVSHAPTLTTSHAVGQKSAKSKRPPKQRSILQKMRFDIEVRRHQI